MWKQFNSRFDEPRHRRTFLLITDEADAFDGMDRKSAEIALYEMGLGGKWWLLESNMTARQFVRVSVNANSRSRTTEQGGRRKGQS